MPHFTKNEIDKMVKINVGNLALEGMICTPEDIETGKRILSGKTTEEEIKKIIDSLKKQYGTMNGRPSNELGLFALK